MKVEPYVRQAVPSDVEELRSWLIEDDVDDYVPDVLEEWVAEGGTYVATDGGRILGMANRETVPDGSSWLRGLRVRGSERRRGVGRLLSRFMISFGDSSAYRLVIDESNEASIALTLETGYRLCLSASLWLSHNRSRELYMTGVDESSLRTPSGDYFGKEGEIVPTAWYAFELNARALRVLNDYGLKIISDRGRNIFLLSTEHRALTPLVLRQRDMLAEVPEGYILFGASDDDFSALGYDQSLWAERLAFFEYSGHGPY